MLFLPCVHPLQYPLAISIDVPRCLTLQFYNRFLVESLSCLVCQDTKDLRVEVLL